MMSAEDRFQYPRLTSPAWRRFRRHRLAGVGGVVLALALLVSLVTLPYSVRWYNIQELSAAVRHAPSLEPVVPHDHYARPRPLPTVGSAVRISPSQRDGSEHNGPHSGPYAGWAYRTTSWLGHDDLGRSLLYRLLPGFLVSLLIGLAAAMMAVVIGVSWGAASALAGGRVDTIMMRIVDVFYSLPYILTVILLKIALTRPLTILLAGHVKVANVVILLLAIGGVSWPTMARVIRGQVLSLRSRPFVEAARVCGAGPGYILRRHLLPNLVGPIVVYAMLVVPQAILQESFLSFLGIGIQQPVPSLGRLAADGVEAVNTFVGFWWLLVFPCGLLVVTLLALNFIGDGLRDALDPKSSAARLI